MAGSLFFCYACNQRFDATGSVDPRCPRCGLALEDMATAPTLDVAAAAAREALTVGVKRRRSGDDSDDPLVGTELGGYSVRELLGRGGMARVYRAFHRALERDCALKVLSPTLVGESARFIDLFFAEARAAASLVHPNIVTVHNIGEDRGLHFIELEYVEGSSLEKRLVSQGRFAPVEATKLMTETVAGLAEAHRVGIVHRDLKPGNVLVSATGVAKLADFGLAKRVLAPEVGGLGLVGTPHFMAPELFEGSPASPLSDVYAAGVSYFFLLTGKLPFTASSFPEVVAKHRSQPAPDPRSVAEDVPEGSSFILWRCLEKRAPDRYPSASELYRELSTLLGRLRDLEDVVREALEGLDVDWREAGADRFRVDVRLPGGRAQDVLIEKRDDLIRISSPCAPVKESYFRRALELNARIEHGALAIRDYLGKEHFVATNAYPWPTCDPGEIRESVLTIAKWADEVERTLTDQDRY